MTDKHQAKARPVPAGLPSADWSPRDIPAGTTTRNVVLRTKDGAATVGTLYVPQGAETVVCIMHPRELMACHYLVPDIVAAGYAAWTQSPRAIGNDLRLEHEIALYEVAAGMTFLRTAGFRNSVLLGNSGGAGLYSLYVQQANARAAERIEKTPGGRPTHLSELDMPVVDGVAFVAPHPGQGALLLQCIDPSVVDESDPLAIDERLDPLNPRNGFVPPPASSRYTQEFVARYRAAQLDRVKRLDQRARDLIEERLAARRRGKEDSSAASQVLDRRKSAHTPIMTIWRTDADLRCFDLSLDPSDRRYGSLWGADPYASNYGCVGFGRICTPESWLSTWSGVSSNARVVNAVPAISQPALVIEYTGDQACFPGIVRQIYESIGSSDKRHERVRGDHHGRALTPDEEPGRLAAGRLLQGWLREKFPL